MSRSAPKQLLRCKRASRTVAVTTAGGLCRAIAPSCCSRPVSSRERDRQSHGCFGRAISVRASTAPQQSFLIVDVTSARLPPTMRPDATLVDAPIWVNASLWMGINPDCCDLPVRSMLPH